MRNEEMEVEEEEEVASASDGYAERRVNMQIIE
jgi:hypothetical protein